MKLIITIQDEYVAGKVQGIAADKGVSREEVVRTLLTFAITELEKRRKHPFPTKTDGLRVKRELTVDSLTS